jgi:hypothetical protein
VDLSLLKLQFGLPLGGINVVCVSWLDSGSAWSRYLGQSIANVLNENVTGCEHEQQ